MVFDVAVNGDGENVERSVQKEWIVQKFGGTSVGKFAVKIAEDIVRSVGSFPEAFYSNANLTVDDI